MRPVVSGPAESVPKEAAVAKRLVDEATVAKSVVVVALVVVALIPVKFCSVVDPVRRRLERVVRPAVAVMVPVKLEAVPIV